MSERDTEKRLRRMEAKIDILARMVCETCAAIGEHEIHNVMRLHEELRALGASHDRQA